MLMAMVMVTVMMMKMRLLPPRIVVDPGSMPSVSSPSESLMKVRFHKFLVSLCVGSLICLHGVGVFDVAKPSTPNMVIHTGRLYPYGCPLKSLVFVFSKAFFPGV
jgi:hypothetical protein